MEQDQPQAQTDKFTLKPVGIRVVDMDDGSVGRIHYFSLNVTRINSEDNTEIDIQLVDEVEGQQIPIIIASLPVIIASKVTPSIIVPKLQLLH